MEESLLIDTVLDLGEKGCRGNANDFQAWIREIDPTISLISVTRALDHLIRNGRLTHHPEIPTDYMAVRLPSQPDPVEYNVPASLTCGPIQQVRSRVETFLIMLGASDEEIMDVIIGVTEAMENAVKYSGGETIHVSYGTEEKEFVIRIVNNVSQTNPEIDIKNGKYSGEATLMRGLMVMSRVFDRMDLEMDENTNTILFMGTKVVAALS